MLQSHLNGKHDNTPDISRITNASQPQAHLNHTNQRHHYEVLHPQGLLHQQAPRVLPDVHHHTVALGQGVLGAPSWPRPLPPPPCESTTGTDTTSTTDLDSSFSYTEESPSYVNSKTCTCQCLRQGLDQPPCYKCCEKSNGGRKLSCSGESLWNLPYTSPGESFWTLPYISPYTTCHTWKSSGNSTLDVRLPRNSSNVKSQSMQHKLKEKLAAENEEEKSFWWLADLENNLAWGVFVFHLGVIPLLLVYSGRAVYFFILPIFLFFCGWIVVRRCGRAVHPCQILAKLALSTSCLMLTIMVCELMNHLPQVTSAIVALSIIILAAIPTGYLICKIDELSC